ncbi:MAG: hypothetical protein BWZ10_00738 [candidate division BRC1 bacterium ADurb.BinA364]|nr:MAG: hypothetical protein BWZ10_00738 [candidate division BRC1 bacterium ADurb.BinA364]
MISVAKPYCFLIVIVSWIKRSLSIDTLSRRLRTMLTNDAPARIARLAWVGENTIVTLVRICFSRSSTPTAAMPAGVIGILITTCGAIEAIRSASAIRSSRDSATASALTWPGTIWQISATTSSKARPVLATCEGLVVTPSSTPEALARLMDSMSAVSRKIFIGIAAFRRKSLERAGK